MSCRCVQVRKVPLPGKAGVYQYTFRCTTASGQTRHAHLVESDDRRAQRLAEVKCAQVAARDEVRGARNNST